MTKVYGKDVIEWETAALVSAVPEEGKMVLTFDKPLQPDDFGSEIEGFSIADSTGAFYMAEAIPVPSKDRDEQNRKFQSSSPLVKAPVAVRYAWARAPMGNLKVNGLPWLPLQSFRTDRIDFSPEVAHQDPEGPAKNSAAIKGLKAEAAAALKTRLEVVSRKP